MQPKRQGKRKNREQPQAPLTKCINTKFRKQMQLIEKSNKFYQKTSYFPPVKIYRLIKS